MVVGVLVEVQGMAADTGGTPDDIGGVRPVDRVLQGRRRDVAIGAPVGMHGHRAVGRMAGGNAGRFVQNDTEAAGAMIYRSMGRRRQHVLVTGIAVHRCLVGVSNDHLHGGAGRCSRVDVTGGVEARRADPQMFGQDIRPVQDGVAVGAGL